MQVLLNVQKIILMIKSLTFLFMFIHLIQNIEEATECFKAMKAIYNTRMKEYVTELTFISEKLKKYDDILTKKKEKKEKDILSNTDTKY